MCALAIKASSGSVVSQMAWALQLAGTCLVAAFAGQDRVAFNLRNYSQFLYCSFEFLCAFVQPPVWERCKGMSWC